MLFFREDLSHRATNYQIDMEYMLKIHNIHISIVEKNLPNVTVKRVFNDITQKTCSKKINEPSRPNNLCQMMWMVDLIRLHSHRRPVDADVQLPFD
ncbi:hypothetical protein GCK72_002301 [Caenorhabditis remanei]|uniref:Uncharacterized protein n=1 Tax=Caenorhabditis remanei TaxID=31234 RepID=A0A6A5HX37_CAERE|nr:hypothetical protein GCK72_002301 [Caenorhabditis remanei]KAF1770482.1 hypothetical protein GCK72_002301 [Caenorhabditis remanei]